MTEQQDNNPISRAKAFLGKESSDASVEELLDQLLNIRTSCHPDRFSDSDAKKEGEDRFKTAQQLIADLRCLHQRQLVRAVGNDLSTQRGDLNNLNLRLNLNTAEAEVANLKNIISDWEARYNLLRGEINAERAARRESELADIRKLYEPSKSRLMGAAIAVLLTGALVILSQLEKVANHLELIWPGAPKATRISLFAFALITLGATLLRWLRHAEFQVMLSHVCTTDFARRFLGDTQGYPWEKRNRNSTRFDEVEVVNFIQKEFTRECDLATVKTKHLPKVICRIFARMRWLLTHPTVVYRRILRLLAHDSYHHLKDAFIHWLIQRQLITAPKAIRLAHEFEALGENEIAE